MVSIPRDVGGRIEASPLESILTAMDSARAAGDAAQQSAIAALAEATMLGSLPAGSAISYASALAVSEAGGEGRRFEVAALFRPGRTLPVWVAADLAALNVPGDIRCVAVMSADGETTLGAHRRRRVASEPAAPASCKIRSLDRAMPDGSIDVDQGGWWVIDETDVTPYMLGAAGDGVTADADAIAAIEAYAPGAAVDLRGRTCVVPALPARVRAYNGTISVGGVKYALRPRPLSHPMEGESWLAMHDGQTHYWGYGFLPCANGRTLYFVKPGSHHAETDGAPIEAWVSEDDGRTFKLVYPVYQRPGYDIAHVVAWRGLDGSANLLARVRDNDGSETPSDSADAYQLVLIKSADDFATAPTPQIVRSGTDESFVFGAATVDPGSGAAYIYGYRGSETRWTRIADNGDVTSGVCFDAGVSEASVVRVEAGKWLMFGRREAGAMIMSTSQDGMTWAAPIDTQIDLRGNPPMAIIDRGRLYVYLMIRDISASGVAAQNRLAVIEDDPLRVYAAKILTGSPRIVASLPDRTTGYFDIKRLRSSGTDDYDQFGWCATSLEQDVSTSIPSSSGVIIGSTLRGATLAGPAPEPTLGLNAMFERSDFGAGGEVSGTTVTRIAPGWSIIPSGSSVAWSISTTPDNARIALGIPTRQSLAISATADDFIGLRHEFYGEDAVRLLAGRSVWAWFYGYGDMPPTPYIIGGVDFGSGGSADVFGTSVALRPYEGAGTAWRLGARVSIPSIYGKLFGIKAFASLTLGFSGFGGGDFRLIGLDVFRSGRPNIAIRPDPLISALCVDQVSETRQLAQYEEIARLEASSATSASGFVRFERKLFPPTVTMPDASLIELRHAATGTVTPVTATAIAVANDDSAQITATTAGSLTVGQSYSLRAKSPTAMLVRAI